MPRRQLLCSGELALYASPPLIKTAAMPLKPAPRTCLFILLTALPAISTEVVAKEHETVNNCKIHDLQDFFDKPLARSTSVTWNGGCQDGYAEGEGYLSVIRAGHIDLKYQGGMHAGKFHGQGEAQFPDGNTYKGGWVDGLMHGKGTFTYKDGTFYTGDLVKNFFKGRGTRTFEGGEKYVGEFADDQANGQGLYTFPDGMTYKGHFRQGNFDGKGKLTWPNGDWFSGPFKNDLADGEGIGSFGGKQKTVVYRQGKMLSRNTSKPDTAGGQASGSFINQVGGFAFTITPDGQWVESEGGPCNTVSTGIYKSRAFLATGFKATQEGNFDKYHLLGLYARSAIGRDLYYPIGERGEQRGFAPAIRDAEYNLKNAPEADSAKQLASLQCLQRHSDTYIDAYSAWFRSNLKAWKP